jgi:hypothetical protein
MRLQILFEKSNTDYITFSANISLEQLEKLLTPEQIVKSITPPEQRLEQLKIIYSQEQFIDKFTPDQLLEDIFSKDDDDDTQQLVDRLREFFTPEQLTRTFDEDQLRKIFTPEQFISLFRPDAALRQPGAAPQTPNAHQFRQINSAQLSNAQRETAQEEPLSLDLFKYEGISREFGFTTASGKIEKVRIIIRNGTVTLEPSQELLDDGYSVELLSNDHDTRFIEYRVDKKKPNEDDEEEPRYCTLRIKYNGSEEPYLKYKLIKNITGRTKTTLAPGRRVQ